LVDPASCPTGPLKTVVRGDAETPPETYDDGLAWSIKVVWMVRADAAGAGITEARGVPAGRLESQVSLCAYGAAYGCGVT
jgi:hypothetical protein